MRVRSKTTGAGTKAPARAGAGAGSGSGTKNTHPGAKPAGEKIRPVNCPHCGKAEWEEAQSREIVINTASGTFYGPDTFRRLVRCKGCYKEAIDDVMAALDRCPVYRRAKDQYH